jgi:hypothetical protein
MKAFITALLLTGVLAVSATSHTFAQENCIPQYDSSGAQTAPYCK